MYNNYNDSDFNRKAICSQLMFQPEKTFSPYNVNFDNTYNSSRFAESYAIKVNEPKKNMQPNVNKILDLNNTMRKLWMEHSIWTKLSIAAIAHDAPDKQFVIQRLLQNPKDFEKIFREYYGVEKGKKFSNLLTEHLTIAADLVAALMDNNTTLSNSLNEKWHNNANEIAEFLNSINKYFDKTEMKKMLYDHLELVAQEANYIINNQYEEGINQFDKIQNQSLKMADSYTEGIIKQFPSRFVY